MILLHCLLLYLLLKYPGKMIEIIIVAAIIVFIHSANEKTKFKSKQNIYYLNNNYYQSTYYLTTHINFDTMMRDPGRNGEYLIYKLLQSHENIGGRFLFNCYIPKNRSQTTEIDVILINPYGIFVFESKNYKGWIFGSEYDTYWIQSLRPQKDSRKYLFYNPILQNETHLRALRNILNDSIPIYSIIVFSNRSVLKIRNIQHAEAKVTNLNFINPCINQIIMNNKRVLTNEKIIQLYNKLYPYTQVSNAVKQQHIANIKNNR